MKISVTGKQIDIGDALRGHIEDTMQDIVDKYFAKALEADVVVSRDGRQYRSDITVHIGRGIHVRSHDRADDAYACFDIAVAHIGKRLRRYKRRLRDHHQAANGYTPEPAQQYVLTSESTEEFENDAETSKNPLVVAETTTEIDRLSVSEAVMRMDLADQSALLFRNAGSGNLNMVYRRNDGNIGWIEPQPE